MNRETKNSIIIAILGVTLGLLISISFNSFMMRKQRRLLKAEYGNWQKLNVILREVQRNYVDTINIEELTDVAVESVLQTLDPHSIYLPPVDLEEANNALSGKFYGIGIMFNVPNDTAIVIDVIPGGPAEKVGLVKGDKIIKVDDKVIAGVHCPQDSMVFRMKGDLDTKVNILVKRDKDLIPFEVKRGKIPMHSVDVSYMINDTTGYIKLIKFNETTYDEVVEAAKKLKESGMKHLIFDIRDNSGGYFNQALLLSNLFLNKQEEIVFLQGLHRDKQTYTADGKGFLQDVGLSVLINQNSASSSEIFAGAIQDNDRGVIIGRRSFGKGLVQEPINFSDGSGIRLTVSRFYTPSGRCIQKPYSKDYQYDIYKRYTDGEMFNRDSIKIDTNEVYHTVGGRVVYGGGGIIPDIFVPLDTLGINKFFIQCNKKTIQMRYSSYILDKYKKEVTSIDSFRALNSFFIKIDLPSNFLAFARRMGVQPVPGEWEQARTYMLPTIKAMIARYTKLGDVAFYSMLAGTDNVIQTALKSSDRIEISKLKNDTSASKEQSVTKEETKK